MSSLGMSEGRTDWHADALSHLQGRTLRLVSPRAPGAPSRTLLNNAVREARLSMECVPCDEGFGGLSMGEGRRSEVVPVAMCQAHANNYQVQRL